MPKHPEDHGYYGPEIEQPVISGDTGLDEDETFRPLQDFLFVKRVDALEKVGSIYVPEVAKEEVRSCHGEVLFAGPGSMKETGEREPMDTKVGDTVMWDGGTGINHREYRKGPTKLVLVAERDVLFVAAPDDDPELADWETHRSKYEPGGDRYRMPDERGFWPVGKHLPQWLRTELEQSVVDGREGRIEMVRDSGKKSGW